MNRKRRGFDGFAARALLPVLAVAVLSCSDAPLIERQARRAVLVELFSSTG
jgi:hypothetical protein